MTDPADELKAAQEQLAALQAQVEALQSKAAAGIPPLVEEVAAGDRLETTDAEAAG